MVVKNKKLENQLENLESKIKRFTLSRVYDSEETTRVLIKRAIDKKISSISRVLFSIFKILASVSILIAVVINIETMTAVIGLIVLLSALYLFVSGAGGILDEIFYLE